MGKHTPEKWKRDGSDSVLCGDEFDQIINEAGEPIISIGTGGMSCESDPYGSYPLLEIGESDLALILAAPDLLAACTDILCPEEFRLIASFLDDTDGKAWSPFLRAKADQIESAVKKANGEE
jgi:hypothetical protein